MPRALTVVPVALGLTLALSLAALAVAGSWEPANPAVAEFVVGVGYGALLIAPISGLALLLFGGLALLRVARTDASANRRAVGMLLER